MVKRKTRVNKSRKRKDLRQRTLAKTKTKHNARKKKSSKKKNSKGATRKVTSPRKSSKRTKLKTSGKKTSSTVPRKSKKSSPRTKNLASPRKAKKQARAKASKITSIVFGGTKPKQSNQPSLPKRYFSKRGRPPSLDRVRRTIPEAAETTVKQISKPSNTEIESLRNKKNGKLVEES
jgi:hypothetical protein